MSFVTAQLLRVVQEQRPDLYAALLRRIRPYSLESVLRVLDGHLRRVRNLNLFNEHGDAIPEFVWTVVKHMTFPTPGDAFGIQLTCRATKSETQGTLDSKHLQSLSETQCYAFNCEKDIVEELALFSTQIQIFELANRHRYATVFLSDDLPLAELFGKLPTAGLLKRGDLYNKGLTHDGRYAYLSAFQFLVVEDRGSLKVLYRSLKDLYQLLRQIPLRYVVGFSDVRNVYKKCGVSSSFYTLLEIVKRQLFRNEDSPYEKAIVVLLKYMFRRGTLSPMNRDGLAKNEDRTPLEKLSFEALKRNCSQLSTGPTRGQWVTVESSMDAIFCGQQPTEGTGYHFACLPAS